MPRLSIQIACPCDASFVDRRRMRQVVKQVLNDAGVATASVSVAIVDDTTIHRLNRQFLKHDYPTDALSFLLSRGEGHLEGEIVVSAETARRVAVEIACDPAHELMLYVIHGALHLVGYDDTTEEAAATMREREKYYLAHARRSRSRETSGRHCSAPELARVPLRPAAANSLELKDA
jgi:probable rRNA maturation factor